MFLIWQGHLCFSIVHLSSLPIEGSLSVLNIEGPACLSWTFCVLWRSLRSVLGETLATCMKLAWLAGDRPKPRVHLTLSCCWMLGEQLVLVGKLVVVVFSIKSVPISS